MGKLRIKIMPNGQIVAETKEIKGEKCFEYLRTLSDLVDFNIEDVQKTEDYYTDNELELDDSQNLSDNG